MTESCGLYHLGRLPKPFSHVQCHENEWILGWLVSVRDVKSSCSASIIRLAICLLKTAVYYQIVHLLFILLAAQFDPCRYLCILLERTFQ